MEKTDNAELEEQIIERLENGEDKDDMLLDLCESMNIGWPEAEALLERIEAENKNHIVLAQSPLLVLIALATFLGGLGLIGFAVFSLVAILESLLHSVGELGVIGDLVYLFAYGAQFWALALLGLGMVIGSLRGMQDVWAAIFEKLGIFQAGE